MTNTVEQLADRLTAARRRANLTQAALGAKVGLAQSHVSKIERAAVDPQTSSLVELARALDLEVMLVPRQLVPAVHALERDVAPDPRDDPKQVDSELARLARAARRAMSNHPNVSALAELAVAADELERARVPRSYAKEVRAQIDGASAALERIETVPTDRSASERGVMLERAWEVIASITQMFRYLRNAILHEGYGGVGRPAYSLDEPDA